MIRNRNLTSEVIEAVHLAKTDPLLAGGSVNAIIQIERELVAKEAVELTLGCKQRRPEASDEEITNEVLTAMIPHYT